MRIVNATVAGAVAAVAALTAPAHASNASPKPAETSAPSSCKAYQQAPDGTWAQLPCQELNVQKPDAAGASRKSATRNPEQQTR